MTILERSDIADLIVTGNGNEVCLSLFMPMKRGTDSQKAIKSYSAQEFA